VVPLGDATGGACIATGDVTGGAGMGVGGTWKNGTGGAGCACSIGGSSLDVLSATLAYTSVTVGMQPGKKDDRQE